MSVSIDEWYSNLPISFCGHTIYPITDGLGGVLEGVYFCETCSLTEMPPDVMQEYVDSLEAE